MGMKTGAQADPIHRSQDHSRLLRDWQPTVYRIINPDVGRIQWVLSNSPQTMLVLRDHGPSEDHGRLKAGSLADARAFGREHAQMWIDKLAKWNLGLNTDQVVFLGLNEPHVWESRSVSMTRSAPQPINPYAIMGYEEPWTRDIDWDKRLQEQDLTHDDMKRMREEPYVKSRSTSEPTLIEALNAYTLAFLEHLDAHGLRGGAYSFSVGWPANTGHATPVDWSPFREVMQYLEANPRHLLATHEYYCKDGPQVTPDGQVDWSGGPWGWTAGRYLQQPYNVGHMIGETGLEQAVCDPTVTFDQRGWQAYYWQHPERYAQMILEYEREIQKQRNILNAQLYLWDGNTHHWGSLFYDQQIPMFGRNDYFSWFADLESDGGIPNPDPDPKPDPDPVPPTDLWQAAEAAARAEQTLRTNKEAALQKAALQDGDVWMVGNEAYFEFGGETYVAQAYEDPDTGERWIYKVKKDDWGNVDRFRSL